jgi:nucleoside 2-deoxyribosyltransferase
MNKKLVYLAGPITGLSYGEARHGWREEFDDILRTMDVNNDHIQCLSPMRGKDHLKALQAIKGTESAYDTAMSRGSGIVCRDRFDVTRHCDVMVANFLGAKVASVGTCIELGWADAARVPIIVVIEDDGKDVGNPHDHLMAMGVAGYRVSTLEEAVHLLVHLLTPAI